MTQDDPRETKYDPVVTQSDPMVTSEWLIDLLNIILANLMMISLIDGLTG